MSVVAVVIIVGIVRSVPIAGPVIAVRRMIVSIIAPIPEGIVEKGVVIAEVKGVIMVAVR